MRRSARKGVMAAAHSSFQPDPSIWLGEPQQRLEHTALSLRLRIYRIAGLDSCVVHSAASSTSP